MNNFKDLLRDLVNDTNERGMTVDVVDDLVDEYYDRFIKEIGKYFELGE